jgi:hypothetical protein
LSRGARSGGNLTDSNIYRAGAFQSAKAGSPGVDI